MFCLLSKDSHWANFGLSFYQTAIPMKFHLRLWPFALVLTAFVSCLEPEDPIEFLPTSPDPSLQSNSVTWEWSELYLDIEKDLPNFRPAPTTRAMAYIHMGAYETMVPGSSKYQSLQSIIDGFPSVQLDFRPSTIDWTIALNAYYARTLSFFLFNASAEDRFEIQRLETYQLEKLSRNVPQGIVNASIEWGQEVANAVIAFSETDREGAIQSRVARPTDYFPPAGTGLWTPTLPDYGAALFPYWGSVRSFAAHDQDLIALPPAHDYNTDPSSAYYQENLEVANAIQNMTPEAHWIAEFWSDDLTGMTFSPPARIFAIANQIIKLEHMSLEETLHMYCRLGIALNDAAVGAWKSKYIYNTERPVHFIHQYIDPQFTPIMGEAANTPGLTPSFPGYPSGHSTFAGVSWRIFEQFFGEQYEFTDHCHFGRIEFDGAPRTFSSWKQMAEENAYSRIPLGVHIRMDCEEGLRLGDQIAARALALDLAK